MKPDTIKVYVPKIFLKWAHDFRVKLHPRYADENYDTDIVINIELDRLRELMDKWGCDIDHPNQYKYPNQVSSGHIYLANGKQFHVRVYKHSKGFMIKGHVEWHGITHPILHMMYANLDYEKGYRMLRNLLEKAGVDILIDKGKGKYDVAEKVIKSKKKIRFLNLFKPKRKIG
jgi:hypothetical protein